MESFPDHGPCSTCGEDLNGSSWPGELVGQWICQMCWEKHCSREWWKAVNEIAAFYDAKVTL